jgi:hypothetical protein
MIKMVIQMRSRKILTAVLVGLLLASVFGPAVALGDTVSTDYSECSLQDWLEWLIEYLIWIMAGRPDGPPVPNC